LPHCFAWLWGSELQEIGIRIALGAERPEVLRLTMGWGLKLVGAGAVLGPLASAAVAAFIPAQRAARFDPLTVLRHE